MAAFRIQHWAAGLAGWGLMNALRLTWDVHLDDPHGLYAHARAGTRPVVYTFWHRYVIPMCVTFDHTRACIAVSQSSDGEYIAQALHRFGFRTVRGSSSRGGLGVLRSLIRASSEGWSPVLTPDGPRGPCYSVQPGFALVARKCGLPVHPVGIAVEPAWELNSWDRFVIPRPGARIVAHMGTGLDPDGYDSREDFCSAMRRALMAADKRARELL
jgi:hypothetical protein